MTIKQSIIISYLILLSFNSHAVDINNGKALHTEYCLTCHTTTKYTAKNHKVRDLATLESRVKRCDFSLGTQWFDEDIADVVAYLNQDFYHFKTEYNK
ncbi:MAG: hypothetical protein AB1Y26_06145 [Cycloclasticus sp.]|nr:hypothetical protein A9Q85_05670 [Cycloclasticus sp. 44_32_T64]